MFILIEKLNVQKDHYQNKLVLIKGDSILVVRTGIKIV